MALKKHTKSLERIAYAATIVVLLLLLIPAIRGKKDDLEKLSQVEPPLAMKVFDTGYEGIDSLLNDGIRAFGKRDYELAAWKLSKAHFYLSVKIKEGEISGYPEELLLYLGLSQFYMGRNEEAAELIAEGEKGFPDDERYPWYLAHTYIALSRVNDAKAELERVVDMGGELSEKAKAKLERLSRVR